MGRRWTDEEFRLLVDLRRGGLSWAAVAERLGRSSVTAVRLKARAGAKRIRKRRTIPIRLPRPLETWQDYALALSDSGWSSREIGARLKRHHTTVLRAINSEFRLDKSRAEKRRRSKRSPEDRRLDSLARAVNKELQCQRQKIPGPSSARTPSPPT